MNLPTGLFGYGKGGLLDFYTAVVEPQIESTGVSGYFNSRQRLWKNRSTIMFGGCFTAMMTPD